MDTAIGRTSYKEKSANVAMWKAKDYKYISNACQMSAQQNEEQSYPVWEQATESAFCLVEFVGHLPPVCPVICVRSLQTRDGGKGRRL